MSVPVNYLSDKAVEELINAIGENMQRYQEGDFSDMATEAGWNRKVEIEIDLDRLSELESSVGIDRDLLWEIELRNSRLVGEAMGELTPAQACVDGLWTRLSHVECLSWSRERNSEHLQGKDEEKRIRMVKKHFFARGVSGRRDDHSISRLWWNAHVAKVLRPDDPESVLKILLRRADIRMQLVERSEIFSRVPLIRSVLNLMEGSAYDRLVLGPGAENRFRIFMKEVNRRGGGVVFERYSEKELDKFTLNALRWTLEAEA